MAYIRWLDSPWYIFWHNNNTIAFLGREDFHIPVEAIAVFLSELSPENIAAFQIEGEAIKETWRQSGEGEYLERIIEYHPKFGG